HPLGTPQHPPPTAAPNARRPHAHPLHRRPANPVLLPLRHPTPLAAPPPLSPLRPLLLRPHLRRALAPLRPPAPQPRLVALRLLLPRAPAPLATSAAHAQIHLRLPPARHHFARRLRRFRHRRPRLLHLVPRHHKHPPDARLQLPHPAVPRVRAAHGPGQRVARKLREPAVEGRAQRRGHGPGDHDRGGRGARVARRAAALAAPRAAPAQGLRQASRAHGRRPGAGAGVRGERNLRAARRGGAPARAARAARRQEAPRLHRAAVPRARRLQLRRRPHAVPAPAERRRRPPRRGRAEPQPGRRVRRRGARKVRGRAAARVGRVEGHVRARPQGRAGDCRV
ncbi:hypothetical protein LTR04_000713, partial [Oleoguttula sp. CCFEE 6159]